MEKSTAAGHQCSTAIGQIPRNRSKQHGPGILKHVLLTQSIGGEDHLAASHRLPRYLERRITPVGKSTFRDGRADHRRIQKLGDPAGNADCCHSEF